MEILNDMFNNKFDAFEFKIDLIVWKCWALDGLILSRPQFKIDLIVWKY